jgi:hypothetical protein
MFLSATSIDNSSYFSHIPFELSKCFLLELIQWQTQDVCWLGHSIPWAQPNKICILIYVRQKKLK